MMVDVGSKSIRRRKLYRRLPRIRARTSGVIDEPPVMWSRGFEANPNSPAGYMHCMWRVTGRGSDTHEPEAPKERRRPISRAGAFVLRVLGYQNRQKGRP